MCIRDRNCHGDVSTYAAGRITPVEEINELRDKFPGIIELSKPTLTMGWCIECHRESNLKVESNEYYKKIHEELSVKYGVENLTVAQMGGLECGKCHY